MLLQDSNINIRLPQSFWLAWKVWNNVSSGKSKIWIFTRMLSCQDKVKFFSGRIYVQKYFNFAVCSKFLAFAPLLSVYFSFLAWAGRFLMKNFLPSLSLTWSLLTFLSFKSLLLTTFHVFLGCPLGNLSLNLKVLQFLD